MSKIAIVVPTIRPEQYAEWHHAWLPLLEKHDAVIITVWDGDEPTLDASSPDKGKTGNWRAEDVLGKDADLIYHHTDACRNLGFAYIAKYLPSAQVVITLDDDVRPDPNRPDPIQAHLDVLGKKASGSWLSSVGWGVPYMRGFPYNTREETEVIISHGVWTGVPDLDAKTQLARPELVGGFEGPFYVGPVPWGVHFPFSGMNVAFKRKALKLMYYAPMGPRVQLHRWADILLGMSLREYFNNHRNGVIFSGASVVRHERASDAARNLGLECEAKEFGEGYWRCHDMMPGEYIEYMEEYHRQRIRWHRWVEGIGE